MCCPNCCPNGQREATAEAEAGAITFVINATTDPDAIVAAIRKYGRGPR